MKKMFLFVLLAVVSLVAVCSGADPAPVAAAAPAVTPVGFLDWFKQNSTVVIGAALALSEVLALIPAFEGNGILDTIIKALRAMSKTAS